MRTHGDKSNCEISHSLSRENLKFRERPLLTISNGYTAIPCMNVPCMIIFLKFKIHHVNIRIIAHNNSRDVLCMCAALQTRYRNLFLYVVDGIMTTRTMRCFAMIQCMGTRLSRGVHRNEREKRRNRQRCRRQHECQRSCKVKLYTRGIQWHDIENV